MLRYQWFSFLRSPARGRALTTLAALWLGTIGCDDDGGSSPPLSSAATSCAKGCARAGAAKCPNQPANCQQQCEAQIAATPAGCIGNVNVYASCLNSAVFSCDADGLAEALGCSAELAAWKACQGISTQPDPSTPDASLAIDARVADTGTPDASAPDASAPDGSASDASVFTCAPEVDDVACDSCVKSQCCAEITACDLSCSSLTACANACPDDDDGSCALTCQQQYPNGIPGLTDVYDCLTAFCSEPCNGDLAPSRSSIMPRR